MSKKLLTRLKEEIRRRNYSYSTEKNYARWVVRYIRFHDTTHPKKLNEDDVSAFLTYLANDANVAASTQNQALSAIIFLYKNILGIPLERLKNFKRARRPKHLPVVLSESEALSIIDHMNGVENLIISLLYGSGLRISEALRLRILDIDFGLNQIVVRNGKGLKDRVTMMPESVKVRLKNQILKVKNLHIMDLEKGFGETILPKALSSKYPNAAKELKWQYLFPSKIRRVDPRSGVRHRYHISPRTVRRALRKALSKYSIQNMSHLIHFATPSQLIY